MSRERVRRWCEILLISIVLLLIGRGLDLVVDLVVPDWSGRLRTFVTRTLPDQASAFSPLTLARAFDAELLRPEPAPPKPEQVRRPWSEKEIKRAQAFATLAHDEAKLKEVAGQIDYAQSPEGKQAEERWEQWDRDTRNAQSWWYATGKAARALLKVVADGFAAASAWVDAFLALELALGAILAAAALGAVWTWLRERLASIPPWLWRHPLILTPVLGTLFPLATIVFGTLIGEGICLRSGRRSGFWAARSPGWRRSRV
jgi:hypothetical protein